MANDDSQNSFGWFTCTVMKWMWALIFIAILWRTVALF